MRDWQNRSSDLFFFSFFDLETPIYWSSNPIQSYAQGVQAFDLAATAALAEGLPASLAPFCLLRRFLPPKTARVIVIRYGETRKNQSFS